VWNQTYGGGTAYSVVVTSDGGYALAGTSSYDVKLVKTDAYGNMEWSQRYGGSDMDEARSLVATSDGGYALAGYTRSFGIGYSDCWLVKTDSDGNMEWNRTYGGEGDDRAYSLVATFDGGYALAGYKSGNFWLVKTDELGNMEWNQTYRGLGRNEAWSLVATSDGGYALTGFINDFDKCWLVKTDASGNMEWNRTYGEGGWAVGTSLITTADDGYAIAGFVKSHSTSFVTFDFWLIKTDASGNMEWNRTYGGKGHDEAHSVVATSDGGYALVGSNASNLSSDCWLVKTDEFGNMIWNQTYGETDWAIGRSLVATSDGGYVIAGTDNNFWLIKTDETGFVPEYSSWLFPLLLLVAALVILVNKKKLFKHGHKATFSLTNSQVTITCRRAPNSQSNRKPLS